MADEQQANNAKPQQPSQASNDPAAPTYPYASLSATFADTFKVLMGEETTRLVLCEGGGGGDYPRGCFVIPTPKLIEFAKAVLKGEAEAKAHSKTKLVRATEIPTRDFRH